MKKIISITLCILIMLSVSGCFGEKKIKGVIEMESGNDWYIVEIPAGKDISDIFNVSGGNSMVVSYFGDNLSPFEGGEGSTYKVQEGGWVSANSLKFLYIPVEYKDWKTAYSYWLKYRSENAMSFEAAKEYIPCMKY